MQEVRLHLPEQILLLAIDPFKGTIRQNQHASLRLVLIASILQQLDVSNRIQITTSRKITLVDSTPFLNPILDNVLAKLVASRKERTVQSWFLSFSLSKGNIQKLVATKLEAIGIIRIETKPAGWFKKQNYTILNSVLVTDMIDSIKKYLMDPVSMKSKTAALVSILFHANQLTNLLDGDNKKAMLKRAKELHKNDLVGKTMAVSIGLMQLAIALGGGAGALIYSLFK